eukprot:613529-Heterocapsa_arctica.AAC.1
MFSDGRWRITRCYLVKFPYYNDYNMKRMLGDPEFSSEKLNAKFEDDWCSCEPRSVAATTPRLIETR